MDEPDDANSNAVADVAKDARDAGPEPVKLRRSSTKKILGGVAGGVAERFDIDANIVRVIFVVLALVYGLGVAIYLAMWLLIPKSSSVSDADLAEIEESDTPRRHWLRYAVALGVVVLVFILFASAHGHAPAGRGLAYLWVLFLIVLAVTSLRTPARRLTLRRFFAFMFLGFLSLLIVALGSLLVALQVIGVPLQGGSGTRTWTPTIPAEVQRVYHGAFGQSTIDLSRVHFAPGTRYVTATQGVGLLVVDLPVNVVLDLRTHVGIGMVDRSPYYDSGASLHSTPTAKSSRPKTPVTRLVLNLQVGIGQIQIERPFG